MEPLLDVRGLRTHFRTDRGLFKAVDGIDFTVGRRQTVGLVGESGCGKSVTSLSVMGLVASPPGMVEGDAILFEGRDLLGLSADERRRLPMILTSMAPDDPAIEQFGRGAAASLTAPLGLEALNAAVQATVAKETVAKEYV